jgi:PKD repeat protein
MKKFHSAVALVLATLFSACAGSTPASPMMPSPGPSTPGSVGMVVITAVTQSTGGNVVNFAFQVAPATNAASVWTIDFGDSTSTTTIIGASDRVTASHAYRTGGSYTVTAQVTVDGNVATGTLDVNVL